MKSSEIFVFGSNLAGRHGAGAAKFAKDKHGAIYGVGEGIQGNSYGIPTKDRNLAVRPLTEIENSVILFLQFANTHSELIFNVTPIGCGLAGYKYEQIASMFRNHPKNVNLPLEFKRVLENDH